MTSVGQGARQAEGRQRGVVEAGDHADPVAGQGGHEQPERPADLVDRVAQVDRERGLAVGPGQ